MSNFVHGRACFARIRGIKEKYDDTRKRARARERGLYDSAFKPVHGNAESVETINDSGGENVR